MAFRKQNLSAFQVRVKDKFSVSLGQSLGLVTGNPPIKTLKNIMRGEIFYERCTST